MGFSKEDRDKKLSELMNKAARGDFALKDPETGEKLSPEDTQAEIMRRITSAREVPEDHQEKLDQAKQDDLDDVPRAVRSLNLQAEFAGVDVRFKMTPTDSDARNEFLDQEVQDMMAQAEEMDREDEATEQTADQPAQSAKKFKPN